MVFHPLVSWIWAGTDQNGTFFDNNWRLSWMSHSGWNGCWTGVRLIGSPWVPMSPWVLPDRTLGTVRQYPGRYRPYQLELALIERKQSHWFRYKIHHMQESYERVWKCANVKCCVELKIDKAQSKRPLVTISPNYTIPTPTVLVLTSTYTQI